MTFRATCVILTTMATLDQTPAVPPALLGQSAQAQQPEVSSLLSNSQQVESLLAVLSQQIPGLQPAVMEFISKLRAALVATSSGGSQPTQTGTVPPVF